MQYNPKITPDQRKAHLDSIRQRYPAGSAKLHEALTADIEEWVLSDPSNLLAARGIVARARTT